MSKEQMIRDAFAKAYPQEIVMVSMHEDSDNEVIEMWCCSMKKYKCTYNNGDIQIVESGNL